MIHCHMHHLQARCRQRGYTLDEVRPCIVSEDGDRLVVDETHPAYPHKRGRGLGDMVAAGLSAIGITPQRISALTGRPCGCKERQRRLNEWGRKVGIG
jgi:hypothetical protein